MLTADPRDSTTAPEASLGDDAPPKVDFALRDRMRAAVERLEALAAEIVAKLDAMTPDADLEPALGAPEVHPAKSLPAVRESLDQRQWAKGGDVDEREPGGDEEPSLGSLGADGLWHSQDHWAGHKRDTHYGDRDLEGEHDGREPDQDGEPLLGAVEGETGSMGWSNTSGVRGEEYSLGSTGTLDQRRWADHHDPSRHLMGDCEEQCEDEGGACEDEGAVFDDEPSLGWSTVGNQGPRIGMGAPTDASLAAVGRPGTIM